MKLVNSIYIPKVINIVILKLEKNYQIILHNVNTNKIINFNIDRNIELEVQNSFLKISTNFTSKKIKMYYKTIYSLIKNNIEDIMFLYKDELTIKGAGFKVALSKNKRFLLFLLGYSHVVYYRVPYDIHIDFIDPKGTLIKLSSKSRQYLYEYISKIKKLKKIDSYKGKGIFLTKDTIILKKPKSAEKK